MLNTNFRWFDITLKGPDLKPKRYMFRGLSWGEWQAAQTKETLYDGEEFILRKCVKNYATGELEGTCRTLLDHIRRISGLDNEEQPMQDAEAWILDPLAGLYEAVACSVLGGVTPTYLRTCDPQDRAKTLLLGKIVFQNMTGKTVEEGFVTLKSDASPGLENAIAAAQEMGHIGKNPDITYAMNGGFDSRRDRIFND